MAEICVEYFKKGASIFVEGRIENSFWTDEKGNKQSRIQFIAREIQFLNSARHGSEEAFNKGEKTDKSNNSN